MSRNRTSAKRAGSSFEQATVDYLKKALNQPAVERIPMGGSKDRGDVGNVHTRAGSLVAVECKNESTLRIPQYLREAKTEAGHYGALCGVAVVKRRGIGMTPARMGEQLVCMTLDDLVRLLLD